ncbi:MAG TPA: hypothetical protein VHS74_13985 [Solirubrobacterales bacterium]|nr:hypothetical protein [Solirubrobacterales bacterium]
MEVAAPADPSESLESTVDCQECGRPLTWFTDDRIEGKWILDEAAEGRRRMAEGSADGSLPTAP